MKHSKIYQMYLMSSQYHTTKHRYMYPGQIRFMIYLQYTISILILINSMYAIIQHVIYIKYNQISSHITEIIRGYTKIERKK